MGCGGDCDCCDCDGGDCDGSWGGGGGGGSDGGGDCDEQTLLPLSRLSPSKELEDLNLLWLKNIFLANDNIQSNNDDCLDYIIDWF